MRTAELARAVGVSPQQVRNYEAQGLLPPVARSPSGYRLFSGTHLDALQVVRAMMRCGYDAHHMRTAMHAVHSGDTGTALALADAQHAELARRRQQLRKTLEAIKTLGMAEPARRPGINRARSLTIGQAAKAVGVRPSALRFWEHQGLLHPGREDQSRYRTYDARQMHRLEIVVQLRAANYSFEAIRSVLDELAAGNAGSMLAAIETRDAEISAASRACAQVTAYIWHTLDDQRVPG